jgi:hypothetical protein
MTKNAGSGSQHCFTPYLVGVQVKPAAVPGAEGVLTPLEEVALYAARLPPLPSLRHQNRLLLHPGLWIRIRMDLH